MAHTNTHTQTHTHTGTRQSRAGSLASCCRPSSRSRPATPTLRTSKRRTGTCSSTWDGSRAPSSKYGAFSTRLRARGGPVISTEASCSSNDEHSLTPRPPPRQIKHTTQGDYPAVMRQRAGDRLPTFTEEQKADLKGSVDFLGINTYSSSLVTNRDSQPGGYFDDLGTKSTVRALSGERRKEEVVGYLGMPARFLGPHASTHDSRAALSRVLSPFAKPKQHLNQHEIHRATPRGPRAPPRGSTWPRRGCGSCFNGSRRSTILQSSM